MAGLPLLSLNFVTKLFFGDYAFLEDEICSFQDCVCIKGKLVSFAVPSKSLLLMELVRETLHRADMRQILLQIDSN